MKIRTNKQRKYCIMPSQPVNDDSLSFAAKGLLVTLFAKSFDGNLSSLAENCSEEELQKLFLELQEAGYAKIEDKAWTVLETKAKKVTPTTVNVRAVLESAEKEVKTNLFTKCVDAVNSYTNDIKLRDVLVEYLKLRLNAPVSSRLRNRRITNVNEWKYLIHTLDAMRGNKVSIVKQSIDNEWAKFVDKQSRDVASSSAYSPEEVQRIRDSIKDWR